MLTNKQRVHMCYSLIQAMLPNSFAISNGFSENVNERVVYAYTDQMPRGNYQTVLYFDIKDEPYGQNISDPYKYTDNNVQVLQQMRQITLTIDCYSKVKPRGTAKDVMRFLNSQIIGDNFDTWRSDLSDVWCAVQKVEMQPDLTPLLEGNVWNERQQMRVLINYRDTTELSPVYMTRIPLDLEDLRNSINYQVIMMELKSDEGDIDDHTNYVGTGIYVTRGDDSNAFGFDIQIEIDTGLPMTGWSGRFQLEDMYWDFPDVTDKILSLTITAEQSKRLPVGTSYGAMTLYDEEGKVKTVMRNVPVYIYPQLVSSRS